MCSLASQPGDGMPGATTGVPTSTSAPGCSSTCSPVGQPPNWPRCSRTARPSISSSTSSTTLGATVAAPRRDPRRLPALCAAIPGRGDRARSPAAARPVWVRARQRPPQSIVFTGDALPRHLPGDAPGAVDPRRTQRIPMRSIPYAEPGTRRCPCGLRSRTGHSSTSRSAPSSPPTRCLRPAIDGLGSARRRTCYSAARIGCTGRTLGPLPANVHVEAFVDQPARARSRRPRRAPRWQRHDARRTGITATRQLLLPKGADQFFNADLMGPPGWRQCSSRHRSPQFRLPPPQRTPCNLAARQPLRCARRWPEMPSPHDVLELLVTRFRSGGQNAPDRRGLSRSAQGGDDARSALTSRRGAAAGRGRRRARRPCGATPRPGRRRRSGPLRWTGGGRRRRRRSGPWSRPWRPR